MSNGTDVIDGQGKQAIVHGDGRIELVDLTPEDIAQQQADAAADQVRRDAADAEANRKTTFITDPERADWLNQLKTATLPQVENFLRNKINADAVTNLASAQTCLKRIETALVIIAKLIALDARR